MKKLIISALRKPITVMVVVIGVIFFSLLAVRKMPVDIFPKLGTPVIYVAQTYGGLSPQQMEGFIASYYEYHFLYVTGIKYVESKSVQGVTLIKLQFHEGTDMANAMAEVGSYASRARSFMPPGTLPPFIMRYDDGSVPVGQLVFTSSTKSLNEIQDLALFKVRPMFSALQGVSAPPPLGGNQRTIIIRADPERLRSYGVTPDELAATIAKGNTVSPAGNLRIGDQALITPQNSVIDNIKEFESIPLQAKTGTAVYVRDVAAVENGADITSGYALVNGKRSIYIPVTKRADASTWDVVQNIKKALPDMQAAIPDDIKVSYEFDQSMYVVNSLKSLLFEGGLGALLTGLMVLLFLADRRSAIIVVITIPLALLSAVVCLYLAGQTINLMTLGGLALAIGILVDEATVTVENIHRHLEEGKSRARAIADATLEIALPKLLILLSILSVFFPALFMAGIPRAMFMPLSLSVGFAMISSFLISQTVVPVISNWLLKEETHFKETGWFTRLTNRYTSFQNKISKAGGWVIGIYLLTCGILLWANYHYLGQEIFPKINAGQVQVRLRMPVGTRIERTEDNTKKVLGIIEKEAGKDKVDITSAYVGLQPATYAINSIFTWTGGPHEAILKVRFSNNSHIKLDDFKEQLRAAIKKEIPAMMVSFEPADLVEQVMSQGTNNPIEVVVQGKNLKQSREIGDKLKKQIASLPYMRDVQYTLPLDYPSIQVDYDRVRAGQLGLTVEEISRSVSEATSSSRNTQLNYWLDKNAGNAYQVQVELPEYQMKSSEDLDQIPVSAANKNIFLRDVATWKKTNTVGEYDRLNQQRFITISANLHKKDLGTAVKDVQNLIGQLDSLPQGVKVYIRGQSEILNQTASELSTGLLLAIAVIFLLLAANFQSFRLSFTVLSTIPAVVAGSFLLLFLAGKTLNIQSFMGCIMGIGVAVANAILLITKAETIRKLNNQSVNIGATAAKERLRPILMTSLAMIAGMIPMAIGFGEGAEQTAPLGIAVIGGLLFSLLTTVFILPLVYNAVIQKKIYGNVSLDPDDVSSKFYDKQINDN
ncbi:efflux RND transporter permease subunit [Flavihumibacter profundi]|uniref:efflux RND transporter permease subunit n=1 Tax=Flavihumibacter profundi TaxID=2716883 RepID=UPI001CC68C8E|nr:efflux RND transporter permease subunit [Flavihumibacter profundi]MBZ5857687.1 efflux RND transporter permease subunit [Flavihumibacter profundi]